MVLVGLVSGGLRLHGLRRSLCLRGCGGFCGWAVDWDRHVFGGSACGALAGFPKSVFEGTRTRRPEAA